MIGRSMRTYLVIWLDVPGWYCATVHADGTEESMGKGWGESDYAGPFLPGYQMRRKPGAGVGLKSVDHIVGNVEKGRMNDWGTFYNRVLGFHQFMSFDDKDISTEFSALRSKVMADPTRSIKFPINEPAAGKRKSQIQEYLDYNAGPGVQHIALATDDIVHTVSLLRENGVEFLDVPATYYD